MNGQPRPAAIYFYLRSVNQQCGVVAGTVDEIMSSATGVAVTSTTGYNVGNSSGKTSCFISLPALAG